MAPRLATSVIESLDVDNADPRDALTRAVHHVWQAWDIRTQRRFLSLALREGVGATTSEPPQVADAVDQLKQQLGPIFDRWIQAGMTQPQSVDGDHLAFELFGLVALTRILYLNATSTRAERAIGHQIVQQHVSYFLDNLFGQRNTS